LSQSNIILAVKSMALAEKIAQLYEQGAGKPRLERYTENWLRWLNGGVSVPAY
jgi:hypothetical protein